MLPNRINLKSTIFIVVHIILKFLQPTTILDDAHNFPETNFIPT